MARRTAAAAVGQNCLCALDPPLSPTQTIGAMVGMQGILLRSSSQCTCTPLQPSKLMCILLYMYNVYSYTAIIHFHKLYNRPIIYYITLKLPNSKTFGASNYFFIHGSFC